MSHHDIHSSQSPDHPSDGHGDADLPADAPAEMPAPRLPRPPFWMVIAGLLGVVASWIPLAMSAVGRTDRSDQPRISLVQDMGMQPKFREQQTNPIFADDRAERPAVPGTVARGDVEEDDFYYRGFHVVHNDATGKDSVEFYKGFPPRVKLTTALLKRGQQRFNIYCSACHGMDGAGNGPVNARALQLANLGADGMNWTPAANLHQIPGRENGNIFNTITNGIRSMPPYGTQVQVADRWAIIAYVRALQFSQMAPASVLTPDQLSELNSK